MDNDTYLNQLRQHHYHLRTEILLLQQHLRRKELLAVAVLSEIQILSTPRLNRTAPHPLEDSPRSLELYYINERNRFQRRLRLLYPSEPLLNISFEEEEIYSSDLYNFHLDHYHFTLSHSRIPPDPNDYYI